MSFAVFVTFRIAPGAEEKFLRRMRKQAANSVTLEPACTVFEVWQSKTEPDLVQLYEIYDDADAFAQHLESDHFKSFDAEIAGMVTQKTVITCDTVFKG